MAMGEAEWRERAQSAEAKLNTLRERIDPVLDRIKQFKMTMGLRDNSDGSIDINFDKFVDALGVEKCLELREIIDEKYRISGEPGEKPKVRVSAGA